MLFHTFSLTNRQYTVLKPFSLRPGERLPAASDDDLPVIEVLIAEGALTRYEKPGITPIGRGLLFSSSTQEPVCPTFMFCSPRGNQLLQEFEDHAAKEAKQQDEQVAANKAAARERRVDRRINIILPFVTLFLGWILGGFTAPQAFSFIRGLFS